MSIHTLLGYKTAIARQEYNLQLGDLFLLNWVLKFALSGKIQFLPGTRAFWIDYTALSKSTGLHPCTLREKFSRLCGKDSDKKYPLIRHSISQLSGGKKIYFELTTALTKIADIDILAPRKRKQLEALMGMGGRRLIMPSKEVAGNRPLNPHVYQLIHTLCKLKIPRTTETLFHTRPPKSPTEYTTTVKNIACMVHEIQEGHFFRERPLSDEFKEWAPSYLFTGAEDAVRACKGQSMEVVCDFILAAARRYQRWFSTANEPLSKDWLPTKIDQWLYSDRMAGGASIFVRCTVADVAKREEAIADKIAEKLPASVVDAAEELYCEKWDPASFWARVRGVYAFAVHAQKQVGSVPNVEWWIGRGAAEWTEAYLGWLPYRTDDETPVHLSNIGVGNSTWDWWMSVGSKRHSIALSSLKDMTKVFLQK